MQLASTLGLYFEPKFVFNDLRKIITKNCQENILYGINELLGIIRGGNSAYTIPKVCLWSAGFAGDFSNCIFAKTELLSGSNWCCHWYCNACSNFAFFKVEHT